MRRILALLILAAWPLKGWGDEGHEVVARIAAQHLTPIAQAQIATLLEVENNPQSVADALAKAATWADQNKAEGETANWHFLNLALQDGRVNMRERCGNDDCLTARLRMFAAQLKANNTDDDAQFSDVDALRFVVHFVGDVNEPMHVTTNADRNGECLPLADWVDGAQNVQAVWDGTLVNGALEADLNREIAAMSDGERTEAAAGEVEDWAWESHRLALLHVYKRLDIPKMAAAFPASCDAAPEEIREQRIVIDENYLDEMRPIVREQLKKAGLRLAKMLNEILD
jgi:hypothetical protein